MNLLPQQFLLLCVCPILNTLIPVYNADGSLFASASEPRLARLQSAGLAGSVDNCTALRSNVRLLSVGLEVWPSSSFTASGPGVMRSCDPARSGDWRD